MLRKGHEGVGDKIDSYGVYQTGEICIEEFK